MHETCQELVWKLKALNFSALSRSIHVKSQQKHRILNCATHNTTQNIKQPPSMSNTSRLYRRGAGLPGTSVNVAVLPSPSPDRRRRPEKRRSNTSRRRGDRGLASAVTAALAQLSRISKKGARAGAALAALYRRVSTLHAGP